MADCNLGARNPPPPPVPSGNAVIFDRVRAMNFFFCMAGYSFQDYEGMRTEGTDNQMLSILNYIYDAHMKS